MPFDTPARLQLDPAASYLVTGGLSGFGFATAEWLAAHGARHLVLVGRRGEGTPGAAKNIGKLRTSGINVDARAVDMADAMAVSELIAALDRSAHPLRGVFHAAAVFDDGIAGTLTRDQFERVIAPKALGAHALDSALGDRKLDHFVLFSSISTLFGNPGQANYVAANMEMESLALQRRRRGLAATAICFPPIEDAGYLVRNTEVREALRERLGVRSMTAEVALQELERLLSSDDAPAVVAAVDVDWRAAGRVVPALRTARFRGVFNAKAGAEHAGDMVDLATLAASLSPAEWADLIGGMIGDIAAEVLRAPADSIDRNKPIFDLGMDSLMLVEMKLLIDERLGVDIPQMSLTESATINRIADRVAASLANRGHHNGRRWRYRRGRRKPGDATLRIHCRAYHRRCSQGRPDRRRPIETSDMTNRLSDLTPEGKQALLRRIIENRVGQKAPQAGSAAVEGATPTMDGTAIPESFYRLDKLPQYVALQLQRAVVDRAGIANPFFSLHEGVARDTTVIGGRELINYSTYNYLDLNGHPEVSRAAIDAIAKYGTSASASRIVSGERPPHLALERALAKLHGVEDAVAFVSGHATNLSVIATLMGPKDLILHDRLAHNSIVLGAQLSGAARQSVPHNNMEALNEVLSANRRRYEKVLIAVEGIYGMDGDAAPLAQLVEIKRRHKALLMVDEAHSVGILGATGRGIGEHAGVKGTDVDIWMGTLSKTLSGCGGYIAGSGVLVDLLKLTAPGFVYSVGMPPRARSRQRSRPAHHAARAGADRQAPANAKLFLELAQAKGLDTGNAEGYNIVPVITGRSTLAARLSNALLERGINVAPIIYPAVEGARRPAAVLRFIGAYETQIRFTVDTVAEELARLRTMEGID